jgi:ribosomal-protein-alanine N-acetyltransferase
MDDFSQITARPAAPADIGQIHALELSCSQNPWSLAGMERELSSPNSVFWVLADAAKNRLAAFACSTAIHDELQILEVAVHPEYRARGLGYMLITRVLKEAAAKNIARVILEVRVSNIPAIKLYEKCGFSKDGVRKRYYQDGEDAVLMSMCIKSNNENN